MKEAGAALSEEAIIGLLTVTKSPGTFVGDSGVVKREENPFVHVLVFTSKRITCEKRSARATVLRGLLNATNIQKQKLHHNSCQNGFTWKNPRRYN